MAIKLSDCFIGNFPETQGYGANPDYYKQFGLAGHEGIDFGMPEGTPVISAHDGVVVRDLDNPVEGKNYGIYCVVWDTVQKCATYYCHLSSNVVSVGQKVVKGQLLGYSGNTGNTTGPHLHFNLCRTDEQGNRINTDNGYLGFINANDKRIALWEIINPEKPVEPPAITVPVDKDLQNACSTLQDAFRSLPDSDPLKQGNLEGFSRAVTVEHLSFADYESKSKILAGFISKWVSEWKLSGGLVEIEAEMAKYLGVEDQYLNIRGEVEKVVGNSYSDDKALLQALDSLKVDKDSLKTKLEQCELKLKDNAVITAFKIGSYLIKIYDAKGGEINDEEN